jgi:hypothetical protein
LAQELEIALQSNSMIRLGPDLILGCIEEPNCLYLRIQLFADQFNPDSVKEALGILLSTGEKISAMLGGSNEQSNSGELPPGFGQDYLAQGGMQI